ncbi:MAG: hypothetical protein ACYC0F_01360 [Rhodanobacter sp.]
MIIIADELPFYFVLGFAAFPAPIGVGAVLYYNAKTSWIVRRIQQVYRAQGAKWPFWTDMDRLVAFILNPDSFLGEKPPLAHEEKVLLVGHRRTMKRYMIRTFVLMLTSFGLAVVLLLLTALKRK